jgi:hypothetical protein
MSTVPELGTQQHAEPSFASVPQVTNHRDRTTRLPTLRRPENKCGMRTWTAPRHSLHGVFDDQEFNPEVHHADRRGHDRQKNDDRGVGAAQRAMFSVEVTAHPVVE